MSQPTGLVQPLDSRRAQRAEAVVDAGAIVANVRLVRSLLAPATQLMVVVKADGYGHGMLVAARAALAAGADWLGVATPDEAMRLRAAGITSPVLCWLSAPGDDTLPLVRAGVDVTVSSQWRLDEIVAAVGSEPASGPARVQLKIDTGLSRNGVAPSELPALVAALAGAVDAGAVRLTGVWSHLACADMPDHPANEAQRATFEDALAVVRAAGLTVPLRHLANSAATLTRPDLHYDLVRVGIAAYGYSPVRDLDPGLRPAMTVRARLAGVKQISAGAGVSYGHAWHAPSDTVVGLVPIGYADGILRSSSGAWTIVHGRTARVVGRVCMDQFVIDLGPDATEQPGDEVVLFGPSDPTTGTATGATADDWADAAGTISYEILTAIHGRVARRAVGEPVEAPAGEQDEAPDGVRVEAPSGVCGVVG